MSKNAFLVISFGNEHSRSPLFSLAAIFLLVIPAVILSSCGYRSKPEQFLERGQKLVDKKEYSRALIEFKNASRANPKNPEPYFKSALAYLGMGDYKNAYANLSRASELDPKNGKVQEKMAELIGSSIGPGWDKRNLEEAQTRVRAALAVVPESPAALSALGLNEYLLGKSGDAVRDLSRAIDKSPGNLQATRSLAMIRMQQNDPAAAEEILKKMVAGQPQSLEANLALARFYVAGQRWSDAESSFQKAVSLDPKSGALMLDLARVQVAESKNGEAEKTLATMSTLPDRQYRSLHAVFLFDHGRQEEAITELEKQVAADPNDREAFSRMTSAYFLTGRLPQAEAAVNSALKKNSRDVNALLDRGRLNLMTAKLGEAESDLNSVLHVEPNSAMAHYLLALVFRAKGDETVQRQQLGEAVRLEPALLNARLQLANLLTRAGAGRNALDLLDHTPESQKNSPAVAAEQNRAWLALGNDAEARRGVVRGLALSRDPDLLMQDALLRIRRKDTAGARQVLEEVMEIRPADSEALGTLANTYRDAGQPSAALEVVQRYLARQPKAAMLQGLAGYWLAANKRNEEARKAYNAALELDPTLAGMRISIAQLDIAEGKLDQARQTLESVARLPAMAAQAEIALAVLEENSGNSALAIPHYRRFVEVNPNNPVVLNNLAYRLADSGNPRDLDEALRFAQQAKELDPKSLVIEDTIGWAFYRKGLYDSAIPHLEACASLQATAVCRYHLAMAYLKAGKRDRGRRTFDDARRLDVNLPEMAVAQKLLDEPAN